jgi:tetratricopeptide (TPR) repeat protein
MQERLDYVELGKVSLGWMKFDPNSTFAITLAGWSLLNIGKPADGRQILAKALEKSPSFTVASYALAYASKGSERHQILKACADVIDPPNSLVGAFKGLCMSELGDSNAPKEVDAWLSESLHKSWLLTIKALIHKNLNNFSLSLQYAEQAIIENKNSSWARLVGSHSALMANHADKASRLAVDGIRISPQHQGLLEIAVAANFAASKPTEALAYFAQLQNLYPQRAGQLKGKLERVGIKF